MQGLINAKIVNLGRHGRTKYIDLAVDREQLLGIIQHDHFLSDLIESMTKLQIFTKSDTVSIDQIFTTFFPKLAIAPCRLSKFRAASLARLRILSLSSLFFWLLT